MSRKLLSLLALAVAAAASLATSELPPEAEEAAVDAGVLAPERE